MNTTNIIQEAKRTRTKRANKQRSPVPIVDGAFFVSCLNVFNKVVGFNLTIGAHVALHDFLHYLPFKAFGLRVLFVLNNDATADELDSFSA